MVSIIIPYYNRPRKLRRCLDSIYAQTYTNFEVIVVDDFSRQKPILPHPEIIYIRNTENLGAGASRNKGLEITKGDYVCFLDSDDYWNKDFLSMTLSKFASQQNLAMVYANGSIVDENGHVVKIRRNELKEDNSIVPNILSHGRPWGTGGCLWDRKAIGNTRWIDATSWEDYAFDISIAIKCNNVMGIPKKLVFYDGTGKDRLSVQCYQKALKGKAHALTYISGKLYISSFKENPQVKNAVSAQLLSSIIAHKVYGNRNTETLKPLAFEFKKWNGAILGNYVSLITKMPTFLNLRLLRKLRKTIKAR